jgi:glycerol kinase
VFTGLNEIKKIRETERIFTPAADKREMDKAYEKWLKAVKQSLSIGR